MYLKNCSSDDRDFPWTRCKGRSQCKGLCAPQWGRWRSTGWIPYIHSELTPVDKIPTPEERSFAPENMSHQQGLFLCLLNYLIKTIHSMNLKVKPDLKWESSPILGCHIYIHNDSLSKLDSDWINNILRFLLKRNHYTINWVKRQTQKMGENTCKFYIW